MKCLVKRPCEPAEELDIDLNDYRAIDAVLGGYMETVFLEPMVKGSIIVLLDEDGMVKNLEPTAVSLQTGTVFVGTLLFVSFDGTNGFEELDVERAKQVLPKYLLFFGRL